MAFCNNCGRPLKEGEVCNCQNGAAKTFGASNDNGQANNQEQMNNGQANYQGQMNNAQANYQGQMNNGQVNYQGQMNNGQGNYQGQMNNGQPNYQGQMNNNYTSNMGAQSQAIMNDIKTLVTGIIKAPVETVSAFMQSKTLVLSVVLILASGLTNALLSILKYAIDDYGYGASTYVRTFFIDILGEAAAGALFAAFVWLLATQMFKSRFSYDKAITVFALSEIVSIPTMVIRWVFNLFKMSFFYEVASWFTGIEVAFTAILMFFAIRSVMGKEKEAAFTCALAAIGTSLGYYFIGLMF